MWFSLHVLERHMDKPHCAPGSTCPMLTHEPPPHTHPAATTSQNTHALPRLLWHALILPQADLSTVAYTVHVITWKYDKHAV